MGKNIKIVVGANFGDEGKGLATDYFASIINKPSNRTTLGVLTNGSSQRAHTVDMKNGRHHIFSHFSSGTFRGVATYISKYFVVNPMKFVDEYLELQNNFGITPEVYVHRDCKVVTPFDILHNITYKEGHNTTGCGFWDTLQRYRKDIGIINWEEPQIFANCLNDTYSYYKRELSIIDPRINIDRLKEHFKNDWGFMCSHVKFVDDYFLGDYEDIIFENGQGLLIGEQNLESDWNYCTPSNTGIKYAVEIIHNTCLHADVEVCYVSRTYLTRHGDGELLLECSSQDIAGGLFDKTNVYNYCQGYLRYGILDIKDLYMRIIPDFCQSGRDLLNKYKCSIMFTHWNEKTIEIPKMTGFEYYISDGHTSGSVRKLYV